MVTLLVFNRQLYDGTDITWNGLRLAERLLDMGTGRARRPLRCCLLPWPTNVHWRTPTLTRQDVENRDAYFRVPV
jgi:hypothetical protein